MNVSGDCQFYRANVIFEKCPITALFAVQLSCPLWNCISVWGQGHTFVEMKRENGLFGFQYIVFEEWWLCKERFGYFKF